jgi:competence protein CoiA
MPMIYAILAGQKTAAHPNYRGAPATCPTCLSQVICKCGPLKVWHWAHNVADCDSWTEPETPWHKSWKERFPIDWREVTIGCHQADVKTPTLVFEFQHSSISVHDIAAREAHYENMVWVFDVLSAKKRIDFDTRDGSSARNGGAVFKWKHPKRTIFTCRKPVFLDNGSGFVLNLSPGAEYYQIYSISEFLKYTQLFSIDYWYGGRGPGA